MQRYAMAFGELATHGPGAVVAAERAHARTAITREGVVIAAIVPKADLDAVDPPDPGLGGADPLLALCGTCTSDDLADALLLQADLAEDAPAGAR